MKGCICEGSAEHAIMDILLDYIESVIALVGLE